ncbi:hypothetical protein LEP1GSC013_0285 [Leptospira interrogans serovar Valbuzzi str. Duyster]|nr:hypothetical protein LEP1GSC201_2590 [Leptospira interrogans serovar Pomona str. Fox 32256]EMI71131.1 hypothetical protein LEP1GSC200_3496 [Leptospira interrogans serovar Pomona str. CSL10083]EMJ49044.1 hypothetical protein LEP1GSC111_4481 [Leptospira interrogans str. UT126]EMJ54977.1 hypothetical protein LEP1GSC013_0285 [Leptospira interrogans serovar Valbuzzi str. Duyster]EMJ63811.1 hypothetical protein LEP1GSC197_0080 [Leptospira interrogans serovar Pomona str. CSL4002]EMN98830.1 hypothe
MIQKTKFTLRKLKSNMSNFKKLLGTNRHIVFIFISMCKTKEK